jgi:ribonuclease HII
MLSPYYKTGVVEAGCDEAGRGCLAGPVVAAAVILPSHFRSGLLNDSKQLSEKERLDLQPVIESSATAYAIGVVAPEIIDEINILNASYLAMQKAIDQLTIRPEHLLIDGNRYKPHNDIPYQCIVKGDGKYASIAAASILAKNYRDALMRKYAEEHQGYGWETNVGYPTPAHRAAIRSLGTTPLHRKSFQLLPAQLELFKPD